MLLRLALMALVVVALAGCSDDGPSEATDAPPTFGELTPGAPEPTPAFQVGQVVLQGDQDNVTIDVQVAAEEGQQAIGLMGRTSMPDDVGMYFMFDGEHQGGFWMKNTLIPLSIAYIGDDSVIVDILDMEPCEADPCTIYTPDEPYQAALEVNQGMFDEWGIEEGDRADLTNFGSE